MKRILPLIAFLVIGLLGYNYYYGTEEDKARSKEVTSKAKDFGTSIINLLKAEQTNFKAGKYDNTFKKVGGIFKDLGRKAEQLGGNFPARLKQLETKLNNLKLKRQQQKIDPVNTNQDKKLEKEMDVLLKDLKALTNEMKNK